MPLHSPTPKSTPLLRKALCQGISFGMVIVLLLTCLTCVSSCVNPDDGGDSENAAQGNQTAAQPVDGDPSSSDPSSNDPSSTTKRVAITFDDGPHTIRTKQIVNELNRYGYTATFFIIGNRADGTAYTDNDTLSFIARSGHELAIHGYTHNVFYNSCTDEEYTYELSKTADVIRSQVPGYEVKLMRPIGGSITTERAASCPYAVILWSVDSEDWKYKYTADDTPEQRQEKVNTIVDNVMSSVRDGSIILMHDIYESTYDATCIILERLHAEGYEVVSVSELLGDPQPGVTYRQKN